MFFNLSLRPKKLPEIMVNTQGKKRKRDHLHSKFSPLSTVVIIFGFVILIGLDFVDQSEHATIDGGLDHPLKLAVDKKASGVTLETMSHLRSIKYYNQ